MIMVKDPKAKSVRFHYLLSWSSLFPSKQFTFCHLIFEKRLSALFFVWFQGTKLKLDLQDNESNAFLRFSKHRLWNLSHPASELSNSFQKMKKIICLMDFSILNFGMWQFQKKTFLNTIQHQLFKILLCEFANFFD